MSEASTKRIIRVFVSSPSDVRPERAIVRRVVARLDREFAYHFAVEAVLWEREPLLTSASPQGVTKPHETDIVVVILWARLGVLTAAADQAGPLSGRQVTGTEWEFEDALAGYKRTHHRPDLLLYRKTAEVNAPLTNRAEVEERIRQLELVEDFVRRWTLDADGKAIIAASQAFIDGGEFEGLFEAQLRGLLQKRLAPGAVAMEVSAYSAPPYRGLQAFGPEHGEIFFGRTRARNEVRELLARQVSCGRPFVLVVGASGSGKSSLIKAALVPDLSEAGMIGKVGLVRTAIVRIGALADPLSSVAAALLTSGALPELGSAPLYYGEPQLASLLAEAPEQVVQTIGLSLLAAGRGANLSPIGEARLLLVIDHLEELFATEVTVRDRVASVLQMLARSELVWVVASLRSDFLNQLERSPPLAHLFEEATYLLRPPTPGEIARIVREPARQAGLRFEVDLTTGESLDDTIIEAAASDPSSLPLLEFLLDQLWCRREGNMLTFSAYQAMGGLAGAISARAEEVVAAQPAEVQAELPRLLRALVTVGQGAVATTRRAEIARFAPGTTSRRLIESLLAADARLLVVDRIDGTDTIRVAHEALLQHWDRASRQIAEDRIDLQLVARLEESQARWSTVGDADRDSLLLPPGLPLTEAKDLVRRRGDELSRHVLEYVARSAEADDARRDAERSAAHELDKARLARQSKKARLGHDSRVFISYRRGDQPGFAGRLYDWLAKVFPTNQLFMYVDNMPAGTDFVEYLYEQVNSCDVLLAVIGEGWRGGRNPEGKYRIEQDDDFVRIEIATALESDKWVIPILIGQTQIISAADLPPSLKSLARRQAIRITHERFRTDVEGLIYEMKSRFEATN